MVVNYELRRLWKEVMTYFKAPSQYLSERNEENHESSWMRMKPKIP